MNIHLHPASTGIAADHNGPVHLLLKFNAPAFDGAAHTPAAFVAVIDRSGSMSGDAIRNAKAAAATTVRALSPGDWFGLVAFSSEVETVIPCGPVHSKDVALQKIDAIAPRDTTDLFGGWSHGRDQLRLAPAGMPRRLLLLTDGLANRGIRDPNQIARTCSEAFEGDGIRTSALGFGEGYDEDLLGRIATASHGELHDASSSLNLPAIFAKELGAVQRVAIEGIKVRVRLHPSVNSVRKLGGGDPVRLLDGRLEFGLGDLVASEERRIVLTFDACMQGRPHAAIETLAELEVCYQHRLPGGLQSERVHHRWEVPVLPAGAEAPIDTEVLPWIKLLEAVELSDRALRLCDRGEHQRALAELVAAMEAMHRLPLSPVMEDALKLLHTAYQKLLDPRRYLRSRKEMMFSSRQFSSLSSRDSSVFDHVPRPSFKPRPPRPDVR